jgi:hypothetical protein
LDKTIEDAKSGHKIIFDQILQVMKIVISEGESEELKLRKELLKERKTRV